MAAVKSALKSIAEPLISVGLRTVLSVPVDGAIAWVKHSNTRSIQSGVNSASC